MSALAQELIDAIVDEVAATGHWWVPPDRKSLKACSLAARTFLVPAQRRLFQSLTLPAKGCDTSHLAAELWGASPIGSYVHHLNIESVSSGHEIILATVFPLLSRVRRLVISDMDQWDTISEPFRTGLISILGLSSLRCVALIRCKNVPLPLLSHALMVWEEVSLTDTEFNHDDLNHDGDSFVIAPPRTPTELRGLTRLSMAYYADPHHVVDTFIVSGDALGAFQRLRHLEVCIQSDGKLSGAEEITQCIDSIEHLVIIHRYYTNGPYLPSLPSLRFLTLKAQVGRLCIPESFVFAMPTLPECMPNVELVTIILEVAAEGYKPDARPWPMTDTALKSLLRLREVRFEVHSQWSTPRRFEEDIARNLPMASEAGLVSISILAGQAMPYDHPMRYFSN
ncbi:hypothetical protein DFH06DRAFT_1300710 [Mycena polygramma]|nr:hypothetical protein DFH06DRAFT_1300710 [Mycena polygramma]